MKKQFTKRNGLESKKAEVYAEMHLIFDNDFEINTITEKTGIIPNSCQNRKDTRINSETHMHNPAFWTIQSKTYVDYTIDSAISDLIHQIESKLDIIKSLCKENDGSVKFDIVPSFPKNNKPGIIFNKKFLDIVHYLDAEIEIDMYVI